MISDNENVTVNDAVGNIMRCSKLSWSMHSKRRSCSIYNRPAILSTTKTTHMHQHRVTRCWLIRSATAVAAHSSSVYYNIRILSTLWVNKQGATFTSANDVMVLHFCVCSSVCPQDNPKSCPRILMNFFGGVECVMIRIWKLIQDFFNGILPLCDRAILRMLPITEDVDDFLWNFNKKAFDLCVKWTYRHTFYPRDAVRKRGLCCRPMFVCPSVRNVGGLYPHGWRYRQTSCSARKPHHSSFWPHAPIPNSKVAVW